MIAESSIIGEGTEKTWKLELLAHWPGQVFIRFRRPQTMRCRNEPGSGTLPTVGRRSGEWRMPRGNSNPSPTAEGGENREREREPAAMPQYRDTLAGPAAGGRHGMASYDPAFRASGFSRPRCRRRGGRRQAGRRAGRHIPHYEIDYVGRISSLVTISRDEGIRIWRSCEAGVDFFGELQYFGTPDSYGSSPRSPTRTPLTNTTPPFTSSLLFIWHVFNMLMPYSRSTNAAIALAKELNYSSLRALTLFRPIT
jgi:hypothetical protein